MVRKALRNGMGLLVIVGIGLIVGARETASDSYLLWTKTNRAPIITSTPPVMTSATYQYDVNATDADGDVLTFSLTNAPAGMTINAATGLILWTATLVQIGTYAPSVTVSDGKGGTAAQTIPLTVGETYASIDELDQHMIAGYYKRMQGNPVSFDELGANFDLNGDGLKEILTGVPDGYPIRKKAPEEDLIEVLFNY